GESSLEQAQLPRSLGEGYHLFLTCRHREKSASTALCMGSQLPSLRRTGIDYLRCTTGWRRRSWDARYSARLAILPAPPTTYFANFRIRVPKSSSWTFPRESRSGQSVPSN